MLYDFYKFFWRLLHGILDSKIKTKVNLDNRLRKSDIADLVYFHTYIDCLKQFIAYFK